jgi:hypothetical protein
MSRYVLITKTDVANSVTLNTGTLIRRTCEYQSKQIVCEYYGMLLQVVTVVTNFLLA